MILLNLQLKMSINESLPVPIEPSGPNESSSVPIQPAEIVAPYLTPKVYVTRSRSTCLPDPPNRVKPVWEREPDSGTEHCT